MSHGPIREHRRTIAALLLLPYLPACTSWQVVQPSPEPLFADEQPEKVRVTQTDGSRVELMWPEVRADSLVGTMKGGGWVAIPLSEVLLVEVGKPNNKGLVIAVGIVVVVGVVVYVVERNTKLFPASTTKSYGP